jgi:signal transduction histidine kinase
MLRIFISFAVMALVISSAAGDPGLGSKDEAVAMVKRVQETFKKQGPEATFQDVTDKSTKQFHDRELYPFIYDLKGKCVAHGARDVLVGKDLIDLKDQTGRYLVREMIQIATGPGNGWVEYKWPNPITNKIENKTAYVEKMGDYFVGVGVYRP